MMPLFLALGLAFRLAHDPWTGKDKAQHLALSFIVVSAGDLALAHQNWDLTRRRQISLGLSLSLGFAKEIYDAVRPGGSGFSVKDLVADLVGASLAWSLGP